MVSIRIASIIAIAAFAGGSLFAPPVQQAIAAVIATDVQCTGCVGTSDVAGNAITGVKVKDGEIKAADIATDAVGAAELQGVTKLLFGQCKADSTEASTQVAAGGQLFVHCSISGVDSDDSAVASLNGGHVCFDILHVEPSTNDVLILMENECSSTQQFLLAGRISIIVYDK